MPSLAVFSILAVSALVTSFISGILGMAGGMIFMGVLLALLTVPQAMVLHGVTQFASNGWRAILWRSAIDWRVFRGCAYGTFAALALFIFVQLVVSKPIALIVLGLTPFVALALPKDLALDVQKRGHSFACGLVCSSLSLVGGVSGPLLDVFFVRSDMDRRAVVATKASTQALGHVVKVGYFGVLVGGAQRGTVDPMLAAFMVVLAITGTTLARRILERMTDASFRQWTRWTVMTTGVVYLGAGAWMLASG
ncbi:MAG: sulfite exporter TauE/SafE family protein [Betaproteobacteria bacterium]|nr:sulfite exporter TauE/SafE family protein [Betaproteobacteria bacterium]